MLFLSLLCCLVLFCSAQDNVAKDEVEIYPTSTLNYQNTELLDSAVLVFMVNLRSKLARMTTPSYADDTDSGPASEDIPKLKRLGELFRLLNEINRELEEIVKSVEKSTETQPAKFDETNTSSTTTDRKRNNGSSELFDEELDEVIQSDEDFDETSTEDTAGYNGYRRRYKGRHGNSRRPGWYKNRYRGYRRRYNKGTTEMVDEGSGDVSTEDFVTTKRYPIRYRGRKRSQGQTVTTPMPNHDDRIDNTTEAGDVIRATKRYRPRYRGTKGITFQATTAIPNRDSNYTSAEVTEQPENDTNARRKGYRGRHRGYRGRHRHHHHHHHGCQPETPEDNGSNNETTTELTPSRHGYKRRHKGCKIHHGSWYGGYRRNGRKRYRYKKRKETSSVSNNSSNRKYQTKSYIHGSTYNQWSRSVYRGYRDSTSRGYSYDTEVYSFDGVSHKHEGPTRMYHLARPEQSSIHNAGRNSNYYPKYFTSDGTFFVEYLTRDSQTSSQNEVRPTRQSTYWQPQSSTSYDYNIFPETDIPDNPDEISATYLHPSTDGYVSSTSTTNNHHTSEETESLGVSTNQYYLAKGEQITIFEGPSNADYSTKYDVKAGSTFVEYVPVNTKTETRKIHLRKGDQRDLLNGPVNTNYHTYYQTCGESIFVDFVSTTTKPSPFFCGTETPEGNYEDYGKSVDYEYYDTY